MYSAKTNPNRPLILPGETLSTQDPDNFYIYHTLPPPPLPQAASSYFHPYISTTPPKHAMYA